MVANKQAKGDGTIYQRASDGMWLGSIELPPVAGKRRRKVVVAKTEAQAKEKLKKVKREVLINGDIPTGSVTVAQWCDIWFRDFASKRLKPGTLATYRTQLEQYIKPVLGKVRLDKLTSSHVYRLHDYIITEKKLSPTTAVQAHRILSVILKDAVRSDRLMINVASKADAPRKAVNNMGVLAPADAIKALQMARGERLWSRWAAALFTGARQGELLGLELDRLNAGTIDLSWQLQRIAWEHGCGPAKNDEYPCGLKQGTKCPARKITHPADWEHRYLQGGLWLSRPKSSAGWRVIPLPHILRPVFEERIIMAQSEPNPHGLLWTSDPKKAKQGDHHLLPLDGHPIDPSRDNKAWHRLLEQAGVPDVRLHDARHTTASLLLSGGVSSTVITKILGHSTYAMSQKYMNVDESLILAGMTAISDQLQLGSQTGT